MMSREALNKCGYDVERMLECLEASMCSNAQNASFDLVAMAKEMISLKAVIEKKNPIIETEDDIARDIAYLQAELDATEGVGAREVLITEIREKERMLEKLAPKSQKIGEPKKVKDSRIDDASGNDRARDGIAKNSDALDVKRQKAMRSLTDAAEQGEKFRKAMKKSPQKKPEHAKGTYDT
jgi:hypothetical protein